MKPCIESRGRWGAVVWSLLLASTPAHAHGLTGEALAILALIYVGVPIVALAALVWLIVTINAPKERRTRFLTGARKTVARGIMAVMVATVLAVGYLFAQSFGKEYMRNRDAQRAESVARADAQARRADEQKAAETNAEARARCHAGKAFVGHWFVRRQGADYVIGLYADGRFSLRDVFHNDGGLRLVREGRWRIEEKIVNGVRESSDFVWLVPGKRSGEQRIAQPVLDHRREAFSLQDARGDTVRYSRESDSPAPPLCD